MFASAWLRLGLLLAALGLFMAAATPATEHEQRAYGRRLVAQYQLPPDTVARYAALVADASPWVGPEQRAGVGHNPYTLVLSVRGLAKTAGDVHAQWQAGWEVRESATARSGLMMAIPRVSRTGLVAGQPVTLTSSSTRVSFRGERSVAPMLGLLKTGNLAIDAVELQIWSGTEPQAWETLAWSRAAWLALGACAVLMLLHVRPSRPAPSGQAAPLARGEAVHAASVTPDVVKQSVPAALAAQAVPAPPAPSHKARVMAALEQVLSGGLAVATVFDEARIARARAKTGPRR